MARPGTFKPGQSGNPGGRPKGVLDVIELARTHTTAAIATLANIAAATKAPAAARVSAASVLLERGWGKPVQPTEGNVTVRVETAPVSLAAFYDAFVPPVRDETRH